MSMKGLLQTLESSRSSASVPRGWRQAHPPAAFGATISELPAGTVSPSASVLPPASVTVCAPTEMPASRQMSSTLRRSPSSVTETGGFPTACTVYLAMFFSYLRSVTNPIAAQFVGTIPPTPQNNDMSPSVHFSNASQKQLGHHKAPKPRISLTCGYDSAPVWMKSPRQFGRRCCGPQTTLDRPIVPGAHLVGRGSTPKRGVSAHRLGLHTSGKTA